MAETLAQIAAKIPGFNELNTEKQNLILGRLGRGLDLRFATPQQQIEFHVRTLYSDTGKNILQGAPTSIPPFIPEE